MNQQDRLADFVKNTSEPVQTLYVPVPIAEQWGEKARIFQNNVVTVLQNRPGTNAALLAVLKQLELHKIGARGLCLFAFGDKVLYARLSSRPKAIFSRGPNPLILPLLRDLQAQETRWVLVVSKTSRALWFVDDNEKIDWTALLEGPDYEDIRARRNVQDDLFFHTSSRGPSANMKFHALGSDVSAQADKTSQSYFRETWAAVSSALPFQVSKLTVIAAEGTLGAFINAAPDGQFEITPLQSGDGLGALSQLSANQTLHASNDNAASFADAKRKARHGRVDTIIIPDRSRITAIVTSDHQGGSENLHLRIANADDQIFNCNEMAIEALKTGADIQFEKHDGSLEKPARKVSIKQRW